MLLNIDKSESLDKQIEKRRDYIENEINIQRETLKNHIDSLADDLIENLDKSCLNAKLNFKCLGITPACIMIEIGNETKTNNSKKEEILLENYFTELKKLNDTESLIDGVVNELSFEPNFDLPSSSMIGQLKTIKEIILIDQFKKMKQQKVIKNLKTFNENQKIIPISPRYLCILDKNNILFTDAQNKNVVQLNLKTNQFVTSFRDVLKNPMGNFSDFNKN
jgi:hypothetical protein